MSTQLSSDLKSTAPARVSRSAVNPFGAKDLTALGATLSPVGRGAREALIATAPHRQSEFQEDLAEYACAAPVATDAINAANVAGSFNAPASARKAAGLRSRTVPRAKPRTSEGCQDDLASVEGLTVALRRARDRSETASRQTPLAGWSPPRFARTIDGNAAAQQRLECSRDRHGGGKNNRTTTSSA